MRHTRIGILKREKYCKLDEIHKRKRETIYEGKSGNRKEKNEKAWSREFGSRFIGQYSKLKGLDKFKTQKLVNLNKTNKQTNAGRKEKTQEKGVKYRETKGMKKKETLRALYISKSLNKIKRKTINLMKEKSGRGNKEQVMAVAGHTRNKKGMAVAGHTRNKKGKKYFSTAKQVWMNTG